jgi:hypothetical protein
MYVCMYVCTPSAHHNVTTMEPQLNVGQGTNPLVIVSLMTAIRHARQNGRYGVNNNRVADWGPDVSV